RGGGGEGEDRGADPQGQAGGVDRRTGRDLTGAGAEQVREAEQGLPGRPDGGGLDVAHGAHAAGGVRGEGRDLGVLGGREAEHGRLDTVFEPFTAQAGAAGGHGRV